MNYLHYVGIRPVFTLRAVDIIERNSGRIIALTASSNNDTNIFAKIEEDSDFEKITKGLSELDQEIEQELLKIYGEVIYGEVTE